MLHIYPTRQLGVGEQLTAFLDAVISSLGFQSDRLVRVFLMNPTGSDCICVGFASAFFERDDGSVGVLTEHYAGVSRSMETCPNHWTIRLA